VPAIVDGHLELWRGKVHALFDGTGKSTMLNVLMDLIAENIFLGRG
jgi:ABC-type sugar transport system ATPase subunit